jgi:hypothetical protein
VRDRKGLSGLQRAAIIVGAVAVLVVAYVLIQSGGDDSSSSGNRTVHVVGGKPQGGVQKLTFKKGDEIRFSVVSDTADEIHVHGYDRHQDVAKGGTVSFAFPGTIEGRFVVELESRSEQIAELDVTP